MKDETEIKGLWYINGPDCPGRSGTLNIGRSALILSVWTPQHRSVDDLTGEAARGEVSSKIPRVIVGVDSNHKPVTLFGCGVEHQSFSTGLRSISVGAMAVVVGLDIKSWDAPVVRAVRFELEHLHRWYARLLLNARRLEDSEAAFTLKETMELTYPLEDGVQIRFVDQVSGSSTEDESRYVSDSTIWLSFKTPRSLDKILEHWRPWVTRLIGVMVGQNLDIKETTIFTADPHDPDTLPFPPSGTLLVTRGRSTGDSALTRPPDLTNIIVPFDSARSELGLVVSNWDRVCSQLEPVLALFDVVVLQRALHLEARFLFLVQAFEVYNASSARFGSKELAEDERRKMLDEAKAVLPAHVWEWAKGKLSLNGRSLSQKLLDVFLAHERESRILLDNFELAASQIAYTRKHLTHHHKEPDQERLLSEKKIALISYALEGLLWIILLREMGLDTPYVGRLLDRYRGISFTHIND